MSKSETNEICANCLKAFNGVNGRYCSEFGYSVEWAVNPPCSEKGGQDGER